MNLPPGHHAGFLVNVFVTEEEAREVRQEIQEDRVLIASLDAEIAKAKSALQELLSQRAATQRLLESNSAPSEARTVQIDQIIRSKESLLEEIQVEIDYAQATLDTFLSQAGGGTSLEIDNARAILSSLLAERNIIQQALEAHRAILSPIRRLPPEVLAEVFLRCLPESTPHVQASVNRCPLLLLQISSTWRNVALSTPAVWASITINLTTKSCLPNPTLVKTWLDRTGSCPLSFHITETIQKDHYEDGMTTSASILAIYAPHYHRWRNVRLEYQDWRINTGFSMLPCDSGPPRALESLHLARDFWPDDEQGQLSLLLSAPRLRHCAWVSNTDLGKLSVPFTQLHRLFLERPMVREDFIRILSDGANIEACQFFVLALSASNVGPPKALPILRHNLSSLDLTADLFGRLFDELELPSLVDLSVRRFDNVPHPTPVWPHQAFMDFLARSKCALEKIDMSDMDITPRELEAFLQHYSASLEKLILTNDRRMRHTIVDDDVLRLLTWSENGQCVCPRLTMLKFWDCHKSSDGVIADMIQSRWIPLPKGGLCKVLNIALFMLEEAKHPDDLRRLGALNEERIGITILRR